MPDNSSNLLQFRTTFEDRQFRSRNVDLEYIDAIFHNIVKSCALDLPGPALIVEAELALLASARRSPYIDILLNPGDFGATAEVIDGSERVDDVQHEYWDPILDRLEERGELPPDLVRTEVVEWLTFIHVGLCARASAFGGDRDHVRRILTRYVATALLAQG